MWYCFGWNMLRAVCRIAAVILLPASIPASDWNLNRSAHFEVYAQAGPEKARALLVWLEQLRAFFARQPGVKLEDRPPVRVMAFASLIAYQPYRLRPAADAYHVRTESRDYIVMANPADFRVAAHEYWHFVEDASALHLPPWLSEGLAEYFSMIRLGGLGGPSPGDVSSRYRTLRSNSWIALPALLTSPAQLRDDRRTSAVFYTECWALAAMLADSAEYGPRFSRLLDSLASGMPSDQSLLHTYTKSLEAIARDLRVWVEKRKFTPVTVPGMISGRFDTEASAVPSFRVRSLLAEVLMSTGKLDRAQALYGELAQEAPDNPDVSAALAMIAVQRGEFQSARERWRLAFEHGIQDAAACYRYALLAQNAGFDAEEIRPALERAVALQPSFDDALYNLALVEKNTGRYEAAVGHLRAMRRVAAGRQFAYWIVEAEALTQLGRREEARAAADTAGTYAETAEQRSQAAQLGFMAVTDLAVQFERDPSGKLRLVTTRAPHDTPDWNPFIEPGDVIRRAEGKLREIDCSGAMTTFAVETPAGILRLLVPDPRHVQIRNAPPEFTCGPQTETEVVAIYAASGSTGDLLRGLEFR